MTMGVIAVALALPLFLNLLLQNVRAATANWNEAFDLSVYMDKKAGAARDRLWPSSCANATTWLGARHHGGPGLASFARIRGSARRSMR
jgi:hypothetical protein